jgi:uncharacterized protein with LGFP repeats
VYDHSRSIDSTIVSALIGAIALVGATVLAHYLKAREKRREEADTSGSKTAPHAPIAVAEAKTRLMHKAASIGVSVGDVVKAPSSSFGTTAFCASIRDGKGALYCHASGERRGNVYHVRGGIGWYYLEKIGGPVSFLGLPISDEAPVTEGQRSTFEGGFIVWKAEATQLVFTTRVRRTVRNWWSKHGCEGHRYYARANGRQSSERRLTLV